MKRTFYQMIGVSPAADQATIAAAFAQAMERLNGEIKRGGAGAATELQLVRDGYQILSDPDRRAKYDAKLAADEAGVEVTFFPDTPAAQRKLGMQSVVFALLATTFCGVVYWQMTRKMSEVRADYETVVARKQADQNLPKVTARPDAVPGNPIVETVSNEPILKSVTAATSEKDSKR
jgi:DnaJ-class molecular chaperone